MKKCIPAAVLAILLFIIMNRCSSDSVQQEQVIARLENRLEDEVRESDDLRASLERERERSDRLFHGPPWQKLDDIIFDNAISAEDCPQPIGAYEVFGVTGTHFVLCDIRHYGGNVLPDGRIALPTAVVREGYWEESVERLSLGSYPVMEELATPEEWSALTDLRHPAFPDAALTLRELASLEFGTHVCLAAVWNGSATYEGIRVTANGNLVVDFNIQGDGIDAYSTDEVGLTPMEGGGWRNTYVSSGRCL